MGKQPLMGVMASTVEATEPYELADSLGFKVIVFAPETIQWYDHTVDGLLYNNGHWTRTICPFPQVIYNRCYTSNMAMVGRVALHVGKNKFFNYTTRFDKWIVYQLLQQTPLAEYQPETWPYQQQGLDALLKKHKSIILKPTKGHYGRGLYRIEQTGPEEYLLYKFWNQVMNRSNSLAQALSGMIHQEIGREGYLLQQFVPFARLNGSLFDIRLLLQKNSQGEWTVSANMSRIAMTNALITNISLKIRPAETVLQEAGFNPGKIMAKIKEIGIKTAISLDPYLGLLGEISVDFGIDEQGKPWIIEVNGMPAKSLFAELQDKDLEERIYLTPFQYANYLLHRRDLARSYFFPAPHIRS